MNMLWWCVQLQKDTNVSNMIMCTTLWLSTQFMSCLLLSFDADRLPSTTHRIPTRRLPILLSSMSCLQADHSPKKNGRFCVASKVGLSLLEEHNIHVMEWPQGLSCQCRFHKCFGKVTIVEESTVPRFCSSRKPAMFHVWSPNPEPMQPPLHDLPNLPYCWFVFLESALLGKERNTQSKTPNALTLNSLTEWCKACMTETQST